MRGIFVLGAGRSGTSAMTRIVNIIGVPVCVPEDLMGGSDFNPKGFWESVTVTVTDEMLLAMAGGRWWCPPSPDAVIEAATPEVRDLATYAFRSVHPTDEWAVKDPRLCFTMPFWRTVLDVQPVALVVVRHPWEVADSLRRWFGFDAPKSFTVWERSLRTVLEQAAGLPAIVAHTRSVIADLHTWCAGTEEFLVRHGFHLHESQWRRDVDEWVEPALLQPAADVHSLSKAQEALLESLHDLEGYHDALPEVVLPEETAATGELIAASQAELRAKGFPDEGSRDLLGHRFSGRLENLYPVVRDAYLQSLETR